MEDQVKKDRDAIRIIRWLARVWSILSVGLVIAFLIGEGFHPHEFKPYEMLAFLFFPVGICVGMIFSWWREALGGVITVGCLLVFYVVCIATTAAPKSWAYLVFAAPGFLFLIAGLSPRRA